jgi:metallo-beta-lactamase family protein
MVNHLTEAAHPAIVIAGNGMCSSGRIVNYLKAMLHDPRRNVLFAGYQAQGAPAGPSKTYGLGGGYAEVDGRRFDIRAQVHTIGGYSGHANQKDLRR